MAALGFLPPLNDFKTARVRKCSSRAVCSSRNESILATPSRTVSILWDLDNKPPTLSPFTVATRLKEAAAAFGSVQQTVALANRHAFIHIPGWMREQRRERKALDFLEKTGMVKPLVPYQCQLCGRKCKTNLDLKKHFKQLHERERQKRMTRMNMLKGKRKAKFQAVIADKEQRYRAASSGVFVPRVGYGLASDLRRAGVFVRTVSDKPEAADIELKRRIAELSCTGGGVVCLVSDDSGFGNVLRNARLARVRTVVIGNTDCLRRYSDAWLSWGDVSSGAAQAEAFSAAKKWLAQDLLTRELLDVTDTCYEEEDSEHLDYRERLLNTTCVDPRTHRVVHEDESEYDNYDQE